MYVLLLMAQQPIDVSGRLPDDDPDEFPSDHEEEEAVTTPASQKKSKKVFFVIIFLVVFEICNCFFSCFFM